MRPPAVLGFPAPNPKPPLPEWGYNSGYLLPLFGGGAAWHGRRGALHSSPWPFTLWTLSTPGIAKDLLTRGFHYLFF